MADRLVESGLVLPVLDGFDEIAEGWRATAIKAINRGLRKGDRLLLTTRPQEYQEAVAMSGVVSNAAAIELKDLDIDAVKEYLPRTLQVWGPEQEGTKWAPVLDRLGGLAADPSAAALESVLATPLMVALARVIYSDNRNADPMELLTSQRDVSQTERQSQLQHDLLGGLVPAVYLDDATPDDQLVGARRWKRARASRWLKFLARHLERNNTYDVAWWRLVAATPAVIVALMTALVMVLAFEVFVIVVGWFSAWPDGHRVAWLAAGSFCALVVALGSGTAVARGVARRPAPSRLRLQIRGRSDQVIEQVVADFRSRKAGFWLAGWLGIGTVMGLVLGGGDGGLFGSLGGLVGGLGIWLLGALATALGVHVQLTETLGPAQLLKIDRRTAQYQGLLVGFGGAIVMWLAMWLVFEPATGLLFDAVFGEVLPLAVLTTAVGGAVSWVLMFTLWGPWLIARFWLSLTRRLPWRLMTFLEDAHQLGVLRQVGAVYQFRHARLQQHLAREAASADTEID